jgi:NitT/TauT family transport system substrate-binding protein
MALFVLMLGTGCQPSAPENLSVEATGPSLVVPLGWLLNDEFAAFVAANELGLYSDAGIQEVIFVSGGGSTGFDPIKAINGFDPKIRFGIPASMAAVIKAYSEGIDVVVIASMLQYEPVAFMTLLKDGRRSQSPCDFAGKVVAIQPDSHWYAEPLGATCSPDSGGPLVPGKDFTVIPAGFTPDCLFSGQCDYYTGWTVNQPFSFEQEGMTLGKDYEMFLMADYLPFYYGDVIVTTRAFINENPEIVAAFVKASVKGIKYVYDNPEAGIDIANKIEGVDPNHAEWRIPVQNLLVTSPETDVHGVGWVEVEKVQSMIQFLYDHDQIDTLFDAKNIVDTSFLEALKD